MGADGRGVHPSPLLPTELKGLNQLPGSGRGISTPAVLRTSTDVAARCRTPGAGPTTAGGGGSPQAGLGSMGPSTAPPPGGRAPTCGTKPGSMRDTAQCSSTEPSTSAAKPSACSGSRSSARHGATVSRGGGRPGGGPLLSRLRAPHLCGARTAPAPAPRSPPRAPRAPPAPTPSPPHPHNRRTRKRRAGRGDCDWLHGCHGGASPSPGRGCPRHQPGWGRGELTGRTQKE